MGGRCALGLWVCSVPVGRLSPEGRCGVGGTCALGDGFVALMGSTPSCHDDVDDSCWDVWCYVGQHSGFYRRAMRIGWKVCSWGRIRAVLLGIPSGAHLGSHDCNDHGLGEALVLCWPSFLLLQRVWAEWFGSAFVGWGSRRTCRYSYAREHTSAVTVTLKMGLERLWRYAGQQSGFAGCGVDGRCALGSRGVLEGIPAPGSTPRLPR